MRYYRLLSAENPAELVTEADLTRRLAEGEITAEAPCRAETETEWRTVGAFLGAAPKLTIRRERAGPSAAETASIATRIDGPTRKRLLACRLADAINIEGFTQKQAEEALRRLETQIRTARRRHAVVALFSGAAMLAAGLSVGLERNPVSRLLERTVAVIRRQDGDAKVSLTVVRSALRDEAAQRERAKK